MNQNVLRGLLAVTLGAAVGCGGPALPKSPSGGAQGKNQALPEGFRNKCDAAKGQLRPLVVEWAAPDRAALESQAQQGMLIAKYQGCELEILRRCRATQTKYAYKYTAITPKDELVTMSSTDQLYASIPVYAARFEGKLAEKGELNAAMTIVGEYGVAGSAPALDQLEGDCAGATHMVSALTVGAFSFFAGSAKTAGATATVMGAGAGIERGSSNEQLSRDGDVKACGASKRGDNQPPDKCGALLRLELVALQPAGAGVPECKGREKLVGNKCVTPPKANELAPEDQSYDGSNEPQGAAYGWSSRCYAHMRAGALGNARAACDRALSANPSPTTRRMALFNYAMVEKRDGDPAAACNLLGKAFAIDQNRSVEKEMQTLKCDEGGKL